MTITEQLDAIKNAFILEDEEIAQILDVSIKALSQQKGSVALFNLYMLAKDWVELGYPRDRNNLNLTLNGKSMFDLLCEGDREGALFVGRYLLRNAESGDLI